MGAYAIRSVANDVGVGRVGLGWEVGGERRREGEHGSDWMELSVQGSTKIIKQKKNETTNMVEESGGGIPMPASIVGDPAGQRIFGTAAFRQPQTKGLNAIDAIACPRSARQC